jgi:hypothetical protein
MLDSGFGEGEAQCAALIAPYGYRYGYRDLLTVPTALRSGFAGMTGSNR